MEQGDNNEKELAPGLLDLIIKGIEDLEEKPEKTAASRIHAGMRGRLARLATKKEKTYRRKRNIYSKN